MLDLLLTLKDTAEFCEGVDTVEEHETVVGAGLLEPVLEGLDQ